MIFKRKVEESCIVDIGNGTCVIVPKEVSKYIKELQDKIYKLNTENFNLTNAKFDLLKELDEIKPVINDKNYEPAISRDCADCKYAVKGMWSRNLIGCRKNNVCEDFVPMKEEKDEY